MRLFIALLFLIGIVQAQPVIVENDSAKIVRVDFFDFPVASIVFKIYGKKDTLYHREYYWYDEKEDPSWRMRYEENGVIKRKEKF